MQDNELLPFPVLWWMGEREGRGTHGWTDGRKEELESIRCLQKNQGADTHTDILLYYYTADFIKKVFSVYTHSMTTIYLSQVASR